MARPKRLVTAAATFTFALGIGFVMQYGDAIAAIFMPEDDAKVPLTQQQAEAVAALGENNAAITTLPHDVSTAAVIGDFDVIAPAAPVDEPVLLAAVDNAEVAAPVFDTSPVQAEANCDIKMSAQALPGAMVALTLNAPCYQGETFVIHHQGMMFSDAILDDGSFQRDVPALAEDAFFIAAFDNSEGAIAQVSVPDLANFDRAVLQWQGEQAIHLHAREYGARYGAEGHLSAEHLVTGDMGLFDEGLGGYIHMLGNNPAGNAFMAEVYTFPSSNAASAGDIFLSAEAEVTAQNCGREMTAQSLQIIPGAAALANDLVMQMPDCDAIGEFLVLNSMFKDLTLASR